MKVVPTDRCHHTPTGIQTILFTIAIILLLLWVLGLVSGTTIGGFVHLLLVIAVIMVLVQVLRGRRLFSRADRTRMADVYGL